MKPDKKKKKQLDIKYSENELKDLGITLDKKDYRFKEKQET